MMASKSKAANSKRSMMDHHCRVLRPFSRLGFKTVATIDSELMLSTLMDCQSLLQNMLIMCAQLQQDLKRLKYSARVAHSSISSGVLQLTKVGAGLPHLLSIAAMVLAVLLTLKSTLLMIQLLDSNQVSTHWL